MAKTKLLQIMGLIYKMQSSEVQALQKELTAARLESWKSTIFHEAKLHGCNIRPLAARGADRRYLDSLSRRDSRSIARTWARDVDRELARLFQANPRGNRNYYISNMETWAKRRSRWKDVQIAGYTEQSARNYAAMRFRKENGVYFAVRYLYVGPAITVRSSQPCRRRTRHGLATAEYIEKNQPPTHPNCFHEWEPTARTQLDCKDIWRGA